MEQLIVFNSGRRYSSKGQRIASCVEGEWMFFVDIDRCVNGKFHIGSYVDIDRFILSKDKVLGMYDGVRSDYSLAEDVSDESQKMAQTDAYEWIKGVFVDCKGIEHVSYYGFCKLHSELHYLRCDAPNINGMKVLSWISTEYLGEFRVQTNTERRLS